MSTIRQKKIAAVLQKELSTLFREQAQTLCKGAMVSVTTVRVAADLSFAKVFISIFGGSAPNDELFQHIQQHNSSIRYALGKRLGKQLRKTPELAFQIDDSIDYAATIDQLLQP